MSTRHARLSDQLYLLNSLHLPLLCLQLHEHEAYRGDRTKEALLTFADNLVPTAGEPHRRHAHLESAPKGKGCNMAGGAGFKGVV